MHFGNIAIYVLNHLMQIFFEPDHFQTKISGAWKAVLLAHEHKMATRMNLTVKR
jgi:hypothetical protein